MYARTSEYVDVLRRSWTEPAAFSHEGEFYKFDDFGPGFAPYGGPIPISIGGRSDEAFAELAVFRAFDERQPLGGGEGERRTIRIPGVAGRPVDRPDYVSGVVAVARQTQSIPSPERVTGVPA